MKKTIRLFALTLACVMLCVPLVGCDKMIRDIKKTTAYELENGNLSFNGEEYILLPEGDYRVNLSPTTKRILVSSADIPMLLAYSDQVDIVYSDGSMVSTSYYHTTLYTYYDHYDYDYNAKYYCRADLYDGVISQIENGIEFTDYGYHYHRDGDIETFFLTKKQTDALNIVMSTVEPETLQEAGYGFIHAGTIYSASIFEFSEDKLLKREKVEANKYGDIYYLSYIADNGETMIYIVPGYLTDTFSDLLEPAVEAHDAMYNYSK